MRDNPLEEWKSNGKGVDGADNPLGLVAARFKGDPSGLAGGILQPQCWGLVVQMQVSPQKRRILPLRTVADPGFRAEREGKASPKVTASVRSSSSKRKQLS